MWRVVLLIISVACFFCSCGSFENELNGELPESKELTFATFNAGLSENTGPWPDIRFSQLSTDISSLSADVVCLQGVWTEEQVGKLTNTVEEETEMKYFAYKITEGNDDLLIPAECSTEDVAPLMQCVMQNCSEDENIATCILTSCNQELLGLPADCRNCLLGEIMGGNADITVIMDKCMTERQYEWAHDGNNGILLMSRHPMKNKEITMLDSFHIVRSAVSATISSYDTRVICTALSDDSFPSDYEGNFDSLQDEQIDQAENIIELADDAEEDIVVIMGDLQSNPAGGYNVFPMNEAVWDVFRHNFFYSPFMKKEEEGKQDCTLCPENPLVDSEIRPAVPDHILFRKRGNISFSSRRLFTRPLRVRVNDEIEEIAISDRYGIFIQMNYRR